jgi:hypothetical protein
MTHNYYYYIIIITEDNGERPISQSLDGTMSDSIQYITYPNMKVARRQQQHFRDYKTIAVPKNKLPRQV